MTASHLHSLLHINVNSAQLAPSRAFYADLLEQKIGMETSETPVDGSSLGFDRFTTTKVLFFYDHRGPRAAPAVELMGWIDPLAEGTTPAEPNHIGLAAIGYAVPSLDAMVTKAADLGVRVSARADAYPLKDAARAVVRLLDVDGCAIEVHEADVPSPQFSHLRLTVADLDTSVEWYGRIGLALQHRYDDVHLTEAESAVAGGTTLSIASLSPSGDPSLSFELTSYSTPAPVGKPITPANHVGLYRIATAVEDVNASRAVLSDGWDGVPEPVWVPLPGTRLGGVNVLFLTDPDGMVVEQVERPRRAMTGR